MCGRYTITGDLAELEKLVRSFARPWISSRATIVPTRHRTGSDMRGHCLLEADAMGFESVLVEGWNHRRQVDQRPRRRHHR